jgi:hypothetical protein
VEYTVVAAAADRHAGRRGFAKGVRRKPLWPSSSLNLMSFLFENPFNIALLGGLTLAIIGGGWYQVQRKELAIAFVAAAILFAGLLVLERSVITDTEAIRATILQIAREAEADDVEALARHFHSSARRHEERLRREMETWQIDKVSVKNNLLVKVNEKSQPKSAEATFNVVVVGGDRDGTIQSMTIPRFITAKFLWEDGEWKCSDYDHDDVRASFQAKQGEE